MKLFVSLLTGIILVAALPKREVKTEFYKAPKGEAGPFEHSTFPIKIFTETAKQAGTSKNFILSPASISTCLGLAYLGAEGVTANELLTVLQLGMKSKEEVAKDYGKFLEKFNEPANTNVNDLRIANRIYVNEKYEVASKFDELAMIYFQSTAEKVNFADRTTAAKKISSWVAEQTNGKITDIVTSNDIDASTSTVLVNAMYFKGHWKKRFDVSKTEKKDFFINKTEKVQVDMMWRQNYYEYADLKELDATAVKIPYVNSDIYFVVLLPNTIDGLDEMTTKLANANLETLQSQFSMKQVNLHLPKFKFEYDTSLNSILSKMGLKSMFDGSVDFSGLLNQKIAPISDVKHKAFIEVDEYGTEASASTIIASFRSRFTYTGKQTIYEFNVNHSFTFAIGDSQGNVYFIGQVTNI